jgi:hypothetical protein
MWIVLSGCSNKYGAKLMSVRKRISLELASRQPPAKIREIKSPCVKFEIASKKKIPPVV